MSLRFFARVRAGVIYWSMLADKRSMTAVPMGWVYAAVFGRDSGSHTHWAATHWTRSGNEQAPAAAGKTDK